MYKRQVHDYFKSELGWNGVHLKINSGESFAPGEIKLYSTDQDAATGYQLDAVDFLEDTSIGAGYHITKWRELDPAGTGSANYLDADAVDVVEEMLYDQATKPQLDVAVSASFSNCDTSGLMLDKGMSLLSKISTVEVSIHSTRSVRSCWT